MIPKSSQTPPYLRRFTHILGITVFMLFLCSTGGSVEIAPEKQIVVVGDESQEPDWKHKWDSGRQHTRNQQYEKAIPYYLEVLEQKPNIEEVKWELCKLYIETAQYQEASLLLYSLLERNPNRIEYLLSAGDIALLSEKQSQAVLFFGRALEQDPGGQYSSRALGGMIDGLMGQGKNYLAIPLMEQLYQSGGSTPTLLENLAHILSQAGDLKKSSYYYQELIDKYRISPLVMRQAAYVFEKLDDMVSAAVLWEHYLEEVPKSHYLRQKLTDYYLSINQSRKAYPHLVYLLENDINRENYLLRAGRINLLTFGRADKALSYFESYTAEYPEGEDVSGEIENIRVILAKNLLSIVENTGVLMLWSDLGEVTTDRIGIYMAMADILEALGKDRQLVEVLQLINIHKPEDLEIRLRLASLYYKKSLYTPCLETLSRETNYKHLTKDYFSLRISCEKAMKNFSALLATYKEYLLYFPDDATFRNKALQFAGDVGDISSLRELLAVYRDAEQGKLKVRLETIKAGVDAYMRNRLYSEAEQLISEIQYLKTLDDEASYHLTRESAHIKYMQGDKFASERLLRIAAVKSHGDINVILDLAGNSLKNNDIDSTLVWLPIARRTLNLMGNERDLGDENDALSYYSFQLDQLSGDSDSMRMRAEKHLQSIDSETAYSMYDFEIIKMLISDYYRNESNDLYMNIISSYLSSPSNSWIATELGALVGPSGNYGDQAVPPSKALQQRSIDDIFDLYDIYMYLGATSQAEKLLDYLQDHLDESVRLEVSRAELYTEQFEYTKAALKYGELSERFPGEEYFYNQMIKFEEYSGKRSVITDSSTAEHGTTKEISDEKKQPKETPGKQIKEARALWLEDKEQEALLLYKKIETALHDKLQTVLTEVKDLPEYQPRESDFFWSRSSGLLGDIEVLDHVMSPTFFSSHLEDKIAIRTARNYENYRWLKIIAKEREAKLALNRREFYQAEIRYQELVEEEEVKNVNVYTDLATVYNRLGRHAKETELLEKIKHKQIVYPQLQAVVEKNINRRRPKLFVDGLFRKEDGRNGDIDIKQQYTGLGLQIQPTLYQEIGFKAGRNIYGNSLDSSLLTSNLLRAHHSLFFGDDVELTSKIGFEDIQEEGNAYFLYDITLTGKLADSVRGYVSIDQSLVSDTISSVAQGIYKRDYIAGLTINYLPRFFLGFDVTLRDYNDGNDGRRIHLWSSYRIFSDVNSFACTYDYEKLENKIDSGNVIQEDGRVINVDLGYWSPANYWKHNLTAKVKRELWPPGKRQSGASFIAAEYGIGYESGDNLVQKFELDILLEISTSFLLKGTFVSDWSDDYNRTETYATFIYRW